MIQTMPRFRQACLNAILRESEDIPAETLWEKLTKVYSAFAAAGGGKEKKKAPSVFRAPTPEDVAKYSAEIGYPMDGEAWCDTYAQKGWMVGKTKMKDWKAAVRTWKTNKWGQGGIALASPTAATTQAPKRPAMR